MMKYQIQKAEAPITIDADWDKPCWHKAQKLELTYHMGQKPDHLPKVQARVMYDADRLYVIFRVEDNYVRAVAEKLHDPVCQDSCVEFFVTPGGDITGGYFNIEMNCGGTLLMYHQTKRDTNCVKIAAEHADVFEIAHSMPKIVEPEIAAPTTWTVEYSFPISMLENYAAVERPAPGVVWKANFYKCADLSSRPHWLTWNQVELPEPDYHQPGFFGELHFV